MIRNILIFIVLSYSFLYAQVAIVKEASNLREKPNTNSKILKLYYKGDRVNIINKIDDWYKTDLGYIYSKLVTISNTSFNKQVKINPFIAIIKKDANLRNKPSLKSKIIKTYLKGQKLTIIDKVFTQKDGVWYKNKDGYISSELIIRNKILEKKPFKNKTFPLYRVTIYEKPNFYSKYIKSIDKDSKIDIECEVSKTSKYPWFKIKEGYINSPYLYKSKNIQKCKSNNKKPTKKIAQKKQIKKIEKTIIQKKEKIVKVNKIIPISKKTIKEKSDSYFIGVALGINSIKADKDVTINSSLENTATSYNIHIGKKFYKNYIGIINYEKISSNDLSFSNYYLSINYQWHNFLNPYIGVSAGISSLKWKIDPLTNSVSVNDSSQNNNFFGLQGGGEYLYNPEYSFFSQLSYLKPSHKTNITNDSNSGSIDHNEIIQLNLGIRYRF